MSVSFCNVEILLLHGDPDTKRGPMTLKQILNESTRGLRFLPRSNPDLLLHDFQGLLTTIQELRTENARLQEHTR